MGKDPLEDFQAENSSHLQLYGVWLILSPLNFPATLSAGSAGAALLAGHTVVIKSATDTPWTVRLLTERFRETGISNGAFNYVASLDSTLGKALISQP